jgi:hypothetical protein
MTLNVDEIYPSKWLKPEDLPTGGLTAPIVKVASEKVKGYDGDYKDAIVVYFNGINGTEKQRALNQTQAYDLKGLLGIDAETWAGKFVHMHAEKLANGQQTIVFRAPPEPAPDEIPFATNDEDEGKDKSK